MLFNVTLNCVMSKVSRESEGISWGYRSTRRT